MAHAILGRAYVLGQNAQFERLSVADGIGPKGSQFESFEFRCSDCEHVESTYLRFSSSADAMEEMGKMLNNASRVLSHSEEADAQGKPVLERVVAVLQPQDGFVILRRRGVNLHWIQSRSLDHALEFEKRSNPDLELRGPPVR